jgi:hypothetical protein
VILVNYMKGITSITKIATVSPVSPKPNIAFFTFRRQKPPYNG